MKDTMKNMNQDNEKERQARAAQGLADYIEGNCPITEVKVMNDVLSRAAVVHPELFAQAAVCIQKVYQLKLKTKEKMIINMYGEADALSQQEREGGDGLPQLVASEDVLKRVLGVFSLKVPNNRVYKWGFACQAMKRRHLIDPRLSAKEFGVLVNKYTGISAETVRHDTIYYEERAEYEDTISQMCYWIDMSLGELNAVQP